jgi:hypothetical protein
LSPIARILENTLHFPEKWIFKKNGFFSGDFIPAGALCLFRAAFLTYSWGFLVRRHLKEVTEMGNRPRLQTILSIMTANPFSPRVNMPVSQRPPPPNFD